LSLVVSLLAHQGAAESKKSHDLPGLRGDAAKSNAAPKSSRSTWPNNWLASLRKTLCRYALEVFPNSSGLGEFADYSDQADCANCADALAFAKFAYFFGNTLLKTRPPALP